MFVWDDSTCSFREVNLLSALTSRNIAYGMITIISAISRLKFHPPTALPTITTMAAR
jgi:hypothetical protein